MMKVMKKTNHIDRNESTVIRAPTHDAQAVGDALPPGLPLSGIACRGARAMLGVSQTTLAEAAGCGRNLLNDFENGVSMPRAANAARIRRTLEGLGAIFLRCGDSIAVGVDPGAASRRTSRARSVGGD